MANTKSTLPVTSPSAARRGVLLGALALLPAPTATMAAVNVAADDMAVKLYRAMKAAELLVEGEEIDNGPLFQAFVAAQDRFIDAPATSLTGVLLKLELAHEYEDFEAMLVEEPNLIAPRVILNLIRNRRHLAGPDGQVL